MSIRTSIDCWLLSLCCVTALAEDQTSDIASNAIQPQPLLYCLVDIPEEFRTTQSGITYGGDLRIGDLNGDGQCDFLVYRCNDGAPRGAHQGGLKPTFLGAFDLSGRPLWRAGEGGNQPSRPMSVAVHDVLGDRAAEVICFWHRPDPERPADWRSLSDVVIQIRDGRSGSVLRESAPEAITARRMKDPQGSNWVHQRLLVANFRGTPTPRDIVVKLGDTYVALDDQLEVLWTYQTEWTEYTLCPAYVPAVGDLDGDGKDEVIGGYFVLRSDGSPIWERILGRNMDSVAVATWDREKTRAVCSGHGYVVDMAGRTILQLGADAVPHGQEVRVGDLLGRLPGPEMVVRYNGHQPSVMVVSSSLSEIVSRLELNASPTNVGMEVVRWNGPEGHDLLFNGGWLWDLEQRKGQPLPGLPPPGGDAAHRMGFYHAVPVDLCGDSREELVVYDPTATSVYIYTPSPFRRSPGSGYHAGPRQYNPRLMD